ncbi:MAG TPA: MOSC domain-containing protein [Thermoanaerobaculia bacterium]|nr:MOSC domain-containing protein [Thermoanaerobaculia bacterium]
MKLISVNVGPPREVVWRGRTVKTSIWKTPTSGRVVVRNLNVAGDAQSDLTVHGGPDKAVYVYPSEHYAFWRAELPDMELSWGAFGENFTTEGLIESEVMIGDRMQIGSAEFQVTQPRMPCFKLGIRFGRDDMIKRFLRSGRTGFYLAVLREGEVGAGDPIAFAERRQGGLSVADVTSLYARDADNQALLRRAAEAEALPESWREYFRKRLWEADS